MKFKVFFVGLALALQAGVHLVSTASYAADSTWKAVDALVDQQKFQAALDQTLQIHKKAQSTQDARLEAEALIRATQLQIGLHGYETAVRFLQEQKWPNDPTARILLHLFYNHALMTYADVDSWEIDSREKTVSQKPLDLKSWTRGQIHDEIDKGFDKILNEASGLDQPLPAFFLPYVTKNNYPEGVRPHLRDAVVYMAVEHWSRTQNWSPEELNETYKPKFKNLLTAASSPRLKAASKAHPLEKIMSWLNDLRQRHAQAKRLEASAEATYEMIEVVHRSLSQDQDQESLREQLKTYQTQVRAKFPWWSRGQAVLARLLMSSTKPDRLRLALQEAQAGVAQNPKSPGGLLCQDLVNEIQEPSFDFQAMAHDGPSERSILVNHKNFRTLYFRAYRIPEENFHLKAHLRRGTNASDFPAHVKELEGELVQSWSEKLPETEDYLFHRKFVTPPLKESGSYWIFASLREDFSAKENIIQGLPFLVTPLVLTLLNEGQGELEARVSLGKTGEVVAGAEVQLYQYEWDKPARLVATKKSSSEGYVVFSKVRDPNNRYPQFLLVARHQKAFTIFSHGLYFGERDTPETLNRSLLYLDRAVYRPQQKIFWKVIVYSGNPLKAKFKTLSAGTSVRIQLLDPNNQQVDVKSVKLNNFGTASGEFVIPTGRPLGAWRLMSDYGPGHAFFRVEEYKRPTFEVEISKATSAYRLNQPVQVEGQAKYYFGLPLSKGEVTWRVTKEEVRPFWWRWSPRHWHDYFFAPLTPPQIVANGTSSLDREGRFRVEFTPQADERAKNSSGVSYQFHLHADVTEEGGEARSGSRAFRIGFTTVEGELRWNETFWAPEDRVQIEAYRKNLDGSPRPGQGQWTLSRLKVPTAATLPTEWPRLGSKGTANGSSQDLQKFGHPDDSRRARWETDFAWDTYLATWPVDTKLSTGTLKHDAEGLAKFRLEKALAEGAYRLEYTTQDDFGAPVEFSKDFLVSGTRSKIPLPFFVETQKTQIEVGDELVLQVHSGFSGQPIWLEKFQQGRRVSRKLIRGQTEESLIRMKIQESDRGGFSLVATMLRDHHLLQRSFSISVPWSNQQLKMELATFRDKLRPGQNETFRISIQSPKGKALEDSVEVLASMYDRSLDLFASYTPPSVLSIYPSFIGVPTLSSSLGQVQANYLMGSLIRPHLGPYFSPDRMTFHQNYGIGGPGSRRGFLKSERTEEMAVAPSASMARENVARVAQAAPALRGKMETASRSDAALPASAPVPSPEPTSVRSDFSETAFFLPHLVSDKKGEVSVEFKVPDSVTSWKFWAQALTRDLKGGDLLRQTESVKDLMVRPQIPRFLREGDEALLKVVLNNASDKVMTGELEFRIEAADSENLALQDFGVPDTDRKKKFSIPARGSTTLAFPLKAPRKLQAYNVRVTAKSGVHSDGELRPLPLLPSRQHLAQSRFSVLKNQDRKTLEFQDLAKAANDPSLVSEKMVVTLDTQLFYSVLQSLPYLVNYPYQCTEQTLNRFLATGIVTSLFHQYPAIQNMADEMSKRKDRFERFDEPDPNRRMTLEETPWLEWSQGGRKNEGEVLLPILDARVARAEREASLERLKRMQLSNGAFPWFEGGRPDEYITLYILLGLSRALEFQVEVPKEMVTRSWKYLRGWLDSEIDRMMKLDCCWEFITFVNYVVGQYPDSSWSQGLFDETYRRKLLDSSFKNWKKHSPLLKGYLALTLKRLDRPEDAKLVWDSVMDSAKTDPLMGTYWAPEDRAWLWYNDTIESHAFALRTLFELRPEDPKLSGLVQWIFLNKKLNHWKSTKATSEVIYSLAHYLGKTQALGGKEEIRVQIGDQEKKSFTFQPDKYTGRKNQIVVPGSDVKPSSSKILVEKTTPGMAFASATWHYATDLLPTEDRGDLFQVSRKYFKRVLAGTQWTLRPLTEGETLRIGDQIEIQLSIRSKQAAQYVHLRDPRGAGFEPENPVSGHRWDFGIGWFEEIRDSGTNFFFAQLPAGEYTLKYRLRANMAGTYRVGAATLQSMYAPEFNAFSAAHILKVEDRRAEK
ncbi:MAG: alpha-2-macroglobulin family protein [Bdellovibrionales bacterium]